MNIDNLTALERETLFRELQKKRQAEKDSQRTAYEGLKASFCNDVENRVNDQWGAVTSFYNWLVAEVEGFRQVMAEYGHVGSKQLSFTLRNGDFKIEVKTNRVKRFDERADMAAARLISFLKDWVKTSDKGTEDPMYQLAMMAIERNHKGDLDYKQVSNLYKLETKFNDPDYTSIMDLFRESHIIEGTATHFYFYERTELGVWKKIEISFNRL